MSVEPASPRSQSALARLPLLLVALLLVACTGSGRGLPDADEFTEGTCRDAAPAVLTLDEQVRGAVEQDVDKAAVRASLREEQSRLQALTDGDGDGDGDGEVMAALEEVIVRVGFARAALDADALETQEVTDATEAIDRFVAACVPAGT